MQRMRRDSRFDHRVGYIIYPSTFKDSNDDGIGDIQGIISKLDYLAEIGFNLLWICPLFASPMDDHGYDVSSYYDIDPRYGTNEDFKQLLEEAHKRDILILIDFVLNHTSDEHPWFKKALADPNCPERNYYFFRKGKRVGKKLLPPNNWKGFFATSAWEKVPGDNDDFYLHIFSKKMPDVNWENPELREQYYQIARHYLDMGVDGFRLDALAHLEKDASFKDSPLPVDEDGSVLDTSVFSNRPKVFTYLNEFRDEVLSHYPCLTVGEVGGDPVPEDALKYADYHDGPIHMVFNFATCWRNGAFCSLDKKDEDIYTDVISLKHQFLHWYEVCSGKCDMPVYWENHDHPRVINQYGSVQFRDRSAKALANTLLFLYGTPFIYNGDEIGMSNVNFSKPEDFYSDIGNYNEVQVYRKRGYSDEHITHYLNRVSRISARTPMQWDDSPHAGFSSVPPPIEPNPNYLEGVNVAAQIWDPWSTVSFFKYAIAKRRDPVYAEIIEKGKFEILDMPHPDVFAYSHDGPRKIVVITNMRPFTVYFSFYSNFSDILVHNYGDVIFRDHIFELRPFETYTLLI